MFTVSTPTIALLRKMQFAKLVFPNPYLVPGDLLGALVPVEVDDGVEVLAVAQRDGRADLPMDEGE